MGFGTIQQLIAQGAPSPITSAVSGGLNTIQSLANLRKQKLANQIQQAQAQIAPQAAQAALLQAQAKPGLTKAQTAETLAQAKALQAQALNPGGTRKLTGLAGDTESDILFKNRYKDNPDALNELKAAHDRVEKAANSRLFSSLPMDERSQMIAQAKTLGVDQQSAVQKFASGETLQDMANEMQEKKNSASGITPTASNAHNETPETVTKSIQDVKEATKPIKWQDITPNFAPTESAKTRAQQSAQASAGLDYLGKYVANNLNYGGITSKITRPWLQDAHSNDPIKQQKAVDYYVAQAVKPELALLRVRIQGGQASARAMAALTPSILGHINVDMANLPARMQKRVQLKATEVLNEAALQSEYQTRKPDPNIFKSGDDASQNISSVVPKVSSSANSNLIKASDGKTYSIEELQKIAQGGK